MNFSHICGLTEGIVSELYLRVLDPCRPKFVDMRSFLTAAGRRVVNTLVAVGREVS